MNIVSVLLSDDSSCFGFDGNLPFKRKILNKAYSNFVLIGKKNNFKIIFTKWNSLSKGKINQFWFFDKGWKKSDEQIVPDFFFDKFNLGKRQNLLRKKLSFDGKLLNCFDMEIFCKDKYAQVKKFPELCPKTFLVKNEKQFFLALKKINSKKVILKPRFGHGGEGIKIIDVEKELSEKKVVKRLFKRDFVLQEMIDSTLGIKDLGVKGVHDLRCMLVDGKVIFCYVREPISGLLANIHLGGKARIVPLPKVLVKKIKKIDSYVKKFGNRVYTIDFIFGKNENKQDFFLLELNSKPGFDVCCKYGYEKIEKVFFDKLFKSIKKNLSTKKIKCKKLCLEKN
jgi:glutathione synthase/RimK-type ligase-like ATP-grasp enzyme